jgi:hypothetical protein
MPRSIAEIRKANGGLENLTDEDILQSTFQQYKSYYPSLDAYAAEVGYGGAGRSLTGSRISAGIDQYQANLQGLGGAVSRAVGAEGLAAGFDRSRTANEAAAAYAAQQARDLGGVEDWRDVTGVGSALNYAGGLAAQSLPYLGEAVAGGLTGGLTLAGTAARVGLGRAAAATAGAVGASYPSAVGDILSAQREAGGENLGAAALGGVPYAALNAVGIEGMAARGLRPLIRGEAGVARRMATGAAEGVVGEGLGETGQEVVNQYAGRMAVDPNETLFNEAANKRYLDSFVGGATLGGLMGGVGGIRAPRQETGPVDLTQPEAPEAQKPTLGLQYSPLAGTPIVFPDGSVALNGEQEMLARVGIKSPTAETDLTAPAATTAAPAGEAKPKVPSIFSELDTKLNKQGIRPTKASRDIYQYMEAEGIDPVSPEAVPVLNALADSRTGDARKAVAEIIRARSPRGTTVPSVQQPTGSVGGGSAVVPGVVGATGSPVAAAGGGVQPTGTAGAAAPQAGVLPVAPSQPAAAVTAPLVDTSDDALEIARATGNAAEIEAMREDEAGLRSESSEFTPADLEAVIEQHLSKSKEKDRDRKILNAYLTARRAVPTGYKGNIAKEIASSFGVAESRVRQIGNPELLANIAESMGFGREQVFDTLGISSAKKAAATELGKLEGELSRLESKAKPSQADINRMSELSEQIDRTKGNIESGDLAAALKSVGLEGEAGESFASLDDAREWQKASTAGSQLAVDLVATADAIDALRAAAAELKSLNLPQAAAAADENINKLTAKYEALAAAAVENAAPKAAPVSKATATVKEAQQRWKDAGRDITKLSSEDLGLLLPYVRDTIKNTELAGKITAELQNRGEADAVQVESPASVPVQPKAEAGQGVGGQVRRAPKPAEKSQAPVQVLTDSEKAAQAWDKVAADFPAAPKFADLTDAQRKTFIGYGEGNWTKADVETELTKLARQPAAKVEYPSTAGQQNAPAYVQPAQRAVVDFMNGEISREDLQQKFADLKMTTGQQRSVTNRIEWFPADFEAVKDIIDGKVRLGPDARMSRGAVEVKYGGRTFQAAKFSLDEMRSNNGVRAAFEHYDSEGMSSLYEDVDIWMIADNSVDFDAAVFPQGDKKVMAFRAGVVLGADMGLVTRVTHHEIGHLADDVFHGGGVSSGRQAMNVSVVNGKIRPMGEVMQEVYDFYKAQPDSEIGKLLQYPFDFQKHGSVSANRLREEVYAQLWAVYIDPELRTELEDGLPTTFDFMEFEYESAKEAASAATRKTNAAAAQGQRVQAAQGDLRASRSTGQRQGLIDRNIAKLPKGLRQPVRNTVGALNDLGGKGLDYVVFTSDLVKRAVAAGMPSAQKFADVLARRAARVSELERQIEKIADGYADIEDEFKGSGRGSVNDFLFESTRTGKWGYGKFRDAKMGAAFDALGPKAQKFVKDVFAHGDKLLADKKKIVMDATTSEYDAMIKAAQVANDKDSEAKLKAEKAATLKRFQTLFRIREGIPYAPIKRNGSQVVIGKSTEYQAAVDANDTKRIKELESDPDHYHVSFVDSKWEARTLKDKLAEQGVFTELDIVTRSQAFEEAFSGEALLPALTKMRAAVDKQTADGKKDPTAGKMLNIINQLYLEALAEGSARKSEMRRRGVAGEVDMLQSFTQQGRADANFLANVQFEPQVQDQLQNMRNESRRGDRERKSEIFNELTLRYADSLDVKPSSWLNGLTNLASKFFLASSPAYYLQNLTQPFMMSLPAMAGRHDYTKAATALGQAYTELGPLFKDVKLFDQQFDFSKVPADVRTAIDELVNQGKIDIGLATEINEYKVDADGKLSQFAQRLNKGMRMAVQKTEAINRLSTAIAAYRLEYSKTKDAAKATQYAADILSDTHGDYTAFNAPRAFNTQWGKVALQFRKFQLIQIAFYAKLIRDAFTKPDERAAAMKTLAYSLAHTGVFAGLMGMPGYAAIAFVLGLFGDEDEPYDLTADMRKVLGPEWADMIMRGAPTLAGVDISGKVGSGNMLSIMPFSNADLTTTSGQVEAFGAFTGGAALGVTTRIVDGLLLMLNGDYYKGLERVMPKGVSDALKAGRESSEGMTRRNGDVVLPESEISSISSVLTALGVPSAKQAVTYERQNRMRDITENFQDRTTRIKNDYAKAARQKDTAAMQQAREAWTKLQQARQRNGLKPQPVSNLLKAPQEQAQREKRTVGGVQYRDGQRKLAEQVTAN